VIHAISIFNNVTAGFFEVCFLALVIRNWHHGIPPQQTLLISTIAGDSFLGVLVGGNNGETISARSNTARRDSRPWGCVLCKVLDWLEANHCDNAQANDRKRAQIILDDLDEKILARHLEDGQWVRT
jgi:hypothetical protein